jgi:hypothetical protein
LDAFLTGEGVDEGLNLSFCSHTMVLDELDEERLDAEEVIGALLISRFVASPHRLEEEH